MVNNNQDTEYSIVPSVNGIIKTQNTNYSTRGTIINIKNTNYSTGGLVINSQDTNYSTRG